MLHRRIFAALFMLCAAVLAFPSVSEAKNVIVSDAQASGVKYEADGYTEHYHPEIATLRELFAKVVESGDVVYIGENWGGSRLDGNEEEVDETWDNEGWLARFLVTEPIEISKDVEIYASCTSRRLGNDTIEVVNLTKNGDMKEDLTTFEGKGKSQIFRITGGAKVTIANLRIHGAYTGSANDGGAVAIFEGSQVTIRNCIIKETHSSTFEDGRSYGKGGGVYVNASRLTLQSSDIRNNTAFGTVGGGIALENGAYALITNSTITSNDTPGPTTYGNGGGIIVMAGCSADIVNSVITKNVGNNGGGIYVVGDSRTGISRVTLTNCTISGNTCKYDGGGIYVSYSSAAIKNSTISDNTCTGIVYGDGGHHHGNGGGIYVNQPQESLTVTDCVITGNSAYASGGGIEFDSSYTITPTAANCLIAYNTAYITGGGIAVNGVAEIDNFTIIGNKAVGYTTTDGQRWYGQGGGIGVSNSWVKMTNSTVTKNSAGYIGGGGIFYSGTVGMECMLSNCTIVDNSAENGGIEIQRDGYIRTSRIPFINSLIYNPTSPDRSFVNKDSERSMFFNCAIPESLALPSTSPSFDIVKIASWNPVSSTETVNGITHTVYRIEDNPALKPLVGAGANRIVRPSGTYEAALDYTSPSFDQLGTTRVNSPDIGAMEKAVTVPVLSADASIHVVVSTEITPITITDTEPNKALTWTVSGDMPSGVAASEDANGMTYTLSGAPAQWGDYSFSVIASNAKGSHDVKVSVTVYTPPVLPDSADLKLIKGESFTQTISADSGNHLVWTASGDIPAGLEVASSDAGLTFSGTPTAAGDYECTFTASNLAGSDDVYVRMTVYEVPVLSASSLAIHTSKDKAMTVQTITATEGNHLAWSVSGTLPAGLSVASSDNSATITGTPTAAGDYAFTVTAANYAGSADAAVSAVVYEAPELSSSALTINAVESTALAAQSVAINAGNHLAWRMTGTFPDGLRYTSSDTTFSISGTPAEGAAGSYDCTFTASNLAGSATLRLNVSVYAMPVLSGDSAVTVYEGEAVSATVSAVSGNDLVWTNSGTLPDGLSVSGSGNSYTISGTPAESTRGIYGYTFTAENYAGEATKTVMINVLTKNYEVKSADVSSPTTLSGFLNTLSADQLAAIETLKLNEYFTDLSGIENLTGLTTLDLTEAAGLTAIDLSSNDAIMTLDIAGNKSVKELNISGGAFKHVNAEECSALSVLNAEDCVGLETLLCASCDISELYLSGCTSLRILDFSFNAIRKFNAQGFTELQTLECAGQAITVQTLSRDFPLRDFLSLAKVSVVEAEPINVASDEVNVKDITGFDASGQEISADYDELAGVAKFASAPHRVTYNYITRDAESMDVTISEYVEPPAPASPDVPVPPTSPDVSVDTKPEPETINTQEEASLSDAIDNLTPEQAAAIETLVVGDKITDLSGLEKLTNLESLDLTSADSLTEVDLSGNTSVKDVDMTGNSSVTTLNLAGSHVERVNAEGCASLEEVNIEGNKTIKELKVSGTNISSLNAKDCENLEVLECAASRVSSMNLEGCRKLRKLDFGGNAVRRFDAEGFPVLEELFCRGQEASVSTLGRVFRLLNFIMSAQVSGVSASADGDNKVLNVKGYDASGQEIASQYNPETGEVTFASAPSSITYDYDTGFEGASMDVTVRGSASEETGDVGSPSGGCDSGAAAMAVLALSAVFVLSKKK